MQASGVQALELGSVLARHLVHVFVHSAITSPAAGLQGVQARRGSTLALEGADGLCFRVDRP